MNQGMLRGSADNPQQQPFTAPGLQKAAPGMWVRQLGDVLGTSTMTANRVEYLEFFWPCPVRIDWIGVLVASTPGAKVNFGQYAPDRNGMPSQLTRRLGTVTTASTGAQGIYQDVLLPAGRSYLALQVDNTAATVFNTIGSPLNVEPAGAAGSLWAAGFLIQDPGSFALPGTAVPSSSPTAVAPVLALRCAA